MFQNFLIAFISLFIALDPLGLVAIFLGMSQGIEEKKLSRIIKEAIFTAILIAIGFMFLGKIVFEAIGISVSDFKIAGGLILLILAIRDLLGASDPSIPVREDIGVVPLGMPLMAGPATITSLLILMDTVGLFPTSIALLTNFILMYFFFHYSRFLRRLLGVSGLKAISKIISLLLAAIAVNMIRKGIQGNLL